MPTINPLHSPFLPNIQQLHHSSWENLYGSSVGLALAALIESHPLPVLIIAPDSLTALRLEYEIAFFQKKTYPIMQFPDWETLPYDHFSPHQDIISTRLKALAVFPQLTQGALITSISTLIHRVLPRKYLDGNIFILNVGDKLNIDKTRQRLEKAGYRCVNQVREHGEFAVRGSLVDLFPMGSDTPFRIDLFDDEIDSIRTFSIETQRSLDKIDKIELFPAKEFPLTEEAIERFRQNWRSQFTGNPLNCSMYRDITEGICPPGIEYYLPFFFETTATLFDYLPDHALIIYMGNTHGKAEEFWHEIQLRYQQRSNDITQPLLTPPQVFIPTADVFAQIKKYPHIKIDNNTLSSTSSCAYVFNTQPPPSLNIDHKSSEPLQVLAQFLKTFKGRVLFCAESAGRREVLLELFKRISLYPKPYLSWQDFLNDVAPCGILVSALSQGLVLEDPAIAVIAETQLFGERIIQQRRRKETTQDPDLIIKDLTELQIGSPIVHTDHGVGRYLGLQTLTVGDRIAEFLSIEYANHDKLYVPISSLHLISRYTGIDLEHAPLHKLGTEQWQKAKRKAAEQVRDVAAELLEIYAQRAARQGIPCQKPDENYATFAAAFPFEETPDQQRAIDQVLADMMSDKAMDRLVCGDVGFGKTEVAMRAAFLAVQNHKQVAVLVPTTLLAQQHYQNFLDRYADWPIHIDMLSRFKSVKEQQNTLRQLAEGKVDIVIGTHKLLQQDIRFKSLGLIIIDEEHRFGVRQKEQLKSLRINTDLLTLTATPIPRTLNMAFAGIRDLSLIATPPARRLSIKTFVHDYENHLVQEAILREIMRGGQVYFLHNDVATIEKMARELEQLVPEARVNIAHGQMRERELEQIMSNFYHRQFNVLVCSTIIESGIDIPAANTIIINRADKFGLAQLHQLRGRVGRSHHQAYAYLFIPSRKTLTADAEKRLEAISAYEDLGVGFTLATHDLEIRGAGDFLGEGQSGNIEAVGFTLYMDLLARAVEALKAGKQLDPEQSLARGTEIDLQITALIPESYLADAQLRLQLYKRIASCKTPTHLDEIQVEMIDRFGLVPEAIKNLFAISLVKQKAEKLGIKKIEAHHKGGKIEFNEKPNIDPMRIIHLIQQQSQRFKLEGPTRLRFTLEQHEPKERITLVEAILDSLC